MKLSFVIHVYKYYASQQIIFAYRLKYKFIMVKNIKYRFDFNKEILIYILKIKQKKSYLFLTKIK
jgi:hypothetical protein